MQSIFDKVWNHLVVEQKKGSYSMEADGFAIDRLRCLYRTEEGLSCAAGCLIPSKDYQPEWEDTAVSCLDYFSAKYNPQQIGLIGQLQGAHDSSCREFVTLGDDAGEGDFVTLVSGALRGVAITYKLTVPEEKST
jgi:hypothetical protein